MTDVKPDSAETSDLLDRLAAGERQALDRLLTRQRPALRSFVEFHLDPRIRARVDPSDVVQDTQLEVVRRIDHFLTARPMPFRLWLRKKAYERLLNLRRYHVTRARRSVAREVRWRDRSSFLLARPLLTRSSSPSQRLAAGELAQRISAAVARLSEADREIMLLRHADDLAFGEIASLLDIEPAAARKRFGRALIRLQKLLRAEGLLSEE
jgi:RNA polymerase sigma-70 factor (ECF subfamily)